MNEIHIMPIGHPAHLGHNVGSSYHNLAQIEQPTPRYADLNALCQMAVSVMCNWVCGWRGGPYTPSLPQKNILVIRKIAYKLEQICKPRSTKLSTKSLNCKIAIAIYNRYRINLLERGLKNADVIEGLLALWNENPGLLSGVAVAAGESGLSGNSGAEGSAGRMDNSPAALAARSAARQETGPMPTPSEPRGRKPKVATPLPTFEDSIESSAGSAPADAEEIF